MNILDYSTHNKLHNEILIRRSQAPVWPEKSPENSKVSALSFVKKQVPTSETLLHPLEGK